MTDTEDKTQPSLPKFLVSFLLANYLLAALFMTYTAATDESVPIHELTELQIMSKYSTGIDSTNDLSPDGSITAEELQDVSGYTDGFQLTDVIDAGVNVLKVLAYIVEFLVVGTAPLAYQFGDLIANKMIGVIFGTLIAAIQLIGWFLLFQFLANKGRFSS